MVEQLHWVDLPDDNLQVILGYDSIQTHGLNELNQAYQVLEKTDPDLLQVRLDRLEDIIEFLDDWLAHKLTAQDKTKHIRILREIAFGKSNYLLQLLKMQQQSISLKQHLEDYHCNSSNSSKFEVVCLNKLRMFSIKKLEYWGDFWLVSLDPCHRQLTNYLRVWEKTCADKDDYFAFFMWLEGQEVPLHQPRECYLTAEQKAKYRLHVKDGSLYTADNNIADFSQPNAKYLYVVDTSLELFVAEETNEMYHSCFCQGKPVVSAGKIIITAGSITAVSFESGHYIPSIEVGYQLFAVLKQQQINMQQVEVSFFYDRNKYTATVQSAEFISCEIFSQKLISSIAETRKCTIE